MKVAYDFEFETERKISPALVEELQQTVDYWKGRHQSDNMPFLFYSKSLDFVTVYDNRGEEGIKQRFEGAAARVIDFCNDGSRTLDQIRSNVQEGGESVADLDTVVQNLIEKRLIYKEGNRHITLALPQNSRL